MINYDPKSWWGLIFKFHKSDTFRRLLPAMVSVALFGAAIAYVDIELWPNICTAPRLFTRCSASSFRCCWCSAPTPPTSAGGRAGGNGGVD